MILSYFFLILLDVKRNVLTIIYFIEKIQYDPRNVTEFNM